MTSDASVRVLQPGVSGALLITGHSVFMRLFSVKVFRVFVVLTCLVAVCIFGSHWFHPLVVPVLPLIFPGLLLFGEEWEPTLGVWGALAAGWIISLPGTYILAWVFSRVILPPRQGSGEPHEGA